MNLFQGMFQGPNVTNVRPGAPRSITFFKEYFFCELGYVSIRHHSLFVKTSKKETKYYYLRQHWMSFTIYWIVKTRIQWSFVWKMVRRWHIAEFCNS